MQDLGQEKKGSCKFPSKCLTGPPGKVSIVLVPETTLHIQP